MEALLDQAKSLLTRAGNDRQQVVQILVMIASDLIEQEYFEEDCPEFRKTLTALKSDLPIKRIEERPAFDETLDDTFWAQFSITLPLDLNARVRKTVARHVCLWCQPAIRQ